MSKCGECLMNDVEIVELNEDGKCPRCGSDYGKVGELSDDAAQAAASRALQQASERTLATARPKSDIQQHNDMQRAANAESSARADKVTTASS